MKKRYLIVGSLAFLQFFAKAQETIKTEKLRKAEVETVYRHYFQDGNNSAVTGGVGTEKLSVYGPSVKYKQGTEQTSFSLNLGIDIISSASTDKIDFVPSSVSSHDIRYYFNGVYERTLRDERTAVSGGLGVSIESDYNSISGSVGVKTSDKLKLKTFSAEFKYFDDDLRWGLFNSTPDEPQGLIYPAELRGIEWHDEFKRYSYNLKLGYQQVINKRTIFGLYPELTYQRGLLATPFHRVYFTDQSLRVENLPDSRFKAALALKLNRFVGGNVVLRNTATGYTDSFGMRAFSIGNETIIKLDPVWSIMSSIRFYSQNGVRYFASFREHDPSQEFYTSDFDLSEFTTVSAGLGVAYKPNSYLKERLLLKQLIFRYSYLGRSTNLNGHSLSLVIQTDFIGKDKTKKG